MFCSYPSTVRINPSRYQHVVRCETVQESDVGDVDDFRTTHSITLVKSCDCRALYDFGRVLYNVACRTPPDADCKRKILNTVRALPEAHKLTLREQTLEVRGQSVRRRSFDHRQPPLPILPPALRPRAPQHIDNTSATQLILNVAEDLNSKIIDS